jgi:hypothetical protein
MDKKSRTLMARSAQPVRITIPASVAYDLPAFQKGLAGLLDRLGCPNCCSGFDIAFLQEREFIIDEKLEIRAISSRSQDRFGPSPEPWLTQNPIRVTMPTKVGYNLEQVQQVLAKVAGRLGCEACCSGFDIVFLQERELIFDEALNIRSF